MELSPHWLFWWPWTPADTDGGYISKNLKISSHPRCYQATSPRLYPSISLSGPKCGPSQFPSKLPLNQSWSCPWATPTGALLGLTPWAVVLLGIFPPCCFPRLSASPLSGCSPRLLGSLLGWCLHLRITWRAVPSPCSSLTPQRQGPQCCQAGPG
jgi:hypothetical protein